MTTIAYDGETLAVDSQITGSYVEYGTKMFEEEGVFVTFCGEYGVALTMVQEYFDGEITARENDTSLVVLKDGILFELLAAGHLIPVDAPYAAGSGGPFAMGAMRAGASADQAVEIAIELDPHSGGDVQVNK